MSMSELDGLCGLRICLSVCCVSVCLLYDVCAHYFQRCTCARGCMSVSFTCTLTHTSTHPHPQVVVWMVSRHEKSG